MMAARAIMAGVDVLALLLVASLCTYLALELVLRRVRDLGPWCRHGLERARCARCDRGRP